MTRVDDLRWNHQHTILERGEVHLNSFVHDRGLFSAWLDHQAKPDFQVSSESDDHHVGPVAFPIMQRFAGSSSGADNARCFNMCDVVLLVTADFGIEAPMPNRLKDFVALMMQKKRTGSSFLNRRDWARVRCTSLSSPTTPPASWFLAILKT